MNKIIRTFFIVVFGLSFFCSCKNNISLQKNQYLLWANDFKGNKAIVDEQLLELIPISQRPNAKPLNLPITPRVWWYYFGKSNFNKSAAESRLAALMAKKDSTSSPKKLKKIQRRIDRKTLNVQEEMGWFWRNAGEKEVRITTEQVNETAKKLNKYLVDIGFRDAVVNYNIKPLSNPLKVRVSYQVNENTLYRIDTVIYEASDTAIYTILNKNSGLQLLKKDDAFDLRTVILEKSRIENVLKNNGYFGLNSRFINHWATTASGLEEDFLAKKRGILKFEVLNPSPNTLHTRYMVDQVIVKSFDPNTLSKAKPDTIKVDNIDFLRLDKNIPINLIKKRIITSPYSYYDLSKILETQKQLSLLNQFSFASSQLKTIAPGKLSLEYFAPFLPKYTLGVSPGINNIYNNDGSTFFGFGIPVSLTMRNKFNKLETIELSTRASYEGQPSPIVSSTRSIRGSLELGLNLNTTLPTLWPFNIDNSKLFFKNPRTIFGLGYSYSEPFWGQRQNFKLNTNYAIQLNRNTNVFVSLFDANLINTVYFQNEAGREFYNSLVKFQTEGNNLKVTFDPQFVSSFNANIVYNNQNLSKPFSNSKFLRVFVESGGTLLNFFPDKDRINFIEKLFPLSQSSTENVRSYFRFIKINADFRKNIQISTKSSLAYRFNVGLINPYGKNRSMPFEKNFFIGGSNSVRAWAPRTLGTGSSAADTTVVGNTIPQPGDILLESSIEYRKNLFHFAGNIQMAAFIDAGNVWKWYPVNVPSKVNKSNFEANRFLRELGVGTGLGIRWDLSYFLFRFDWGIKVFDPGLERGSRYVLDDFRLKRNAPYGVNWNFGIGYPF